MKLVKLEIRDFKRAEAVELEFDGAGLVEVAGRNSQGKTSVLDAIAAAFGGPRAISATEQPIRKGAKKAQIIAETDTLTIERTFTPSGQTVRVSTKDGVSYQKPQGILDKLFSSLTFDPLSFASSKPAERRETLIAALGLAGELEKIDRARAGAYERRTEANRDVKRLRAQLEAVPEPDPFTPDEETSAGDILAEIAAATDLEQKRANIETSILNIATTRASLETEREALRERLAALDRRIDLLGPEAEALEAALGTIVVPDLAGLRADLAGIEQTNAAARAAKAFRELQASLQSAEELSKDAETQIEACDAAKADLVRGAALPVDDLELGEDDLTLAGVPFGQVSTSEQIRTATAIAMRLNPELRVLRIAEGSLLDADNRRAIQELAEANDFLVLVETVRDEPTGNLTEIFIEEGHVRATAAAD